MKEMKKIIAAVASVAIASTMTGCTPSINIGSNSTVAMTIDGYEVPAGLFIYYTMQGYSDAQSVISEQTGTTPELKDVKNAYIDSVDSTTWIQNKATDYCLDYVTIVKEFDEIGEELSQEDIDYAESMAQYYYSMNGNIEENGVSIDTMNAMAQMSYKEQAVFKHYYNFDSEYGCSEDELKDYFDENFARVKYVSISLLDSEGELLGEDEQRELRKMAESYANQVNGKTSEIDMMHEIDAVQEDYDDYVASTTTTVEDEVVTTTTTTTTTADSDETTTTTTTDPYANERLIQKATTTTASADSENAETTTEAVEETEDEKNTRLFNDFIFNELPCGDAKVYDYSEDTIYVIVRADLRERMTEDDYWSEEYIDNLMQMKYYDEFIEMLKAKSDSLTIEKNNTAYKRYEPFKLALEFE